MLTAHAVGFAQQRDGTPPLFGSPVTYMWGGYGPPSAMAVADVNRDGQPDILATTCDTDVSCGTVALLLGNGAGAFRGPLTFDSGGNGASAIAVADVTRDGRVDLVVAHFASDTVGILAGHGDGSFEPAIVYPTVATDSGAAGPASVAAADLNGDRVLDLVITHSQSSTGAARAISVLHGKADGTFRAPIALASGGLSARTVTVADVDRDGTPDLVVSNDWASVGDKTHASVAVLLGNGIGGFRSAVPYTTGGWGAGAASVTDVNADGAPDVIVANGKPKSVAVLLGTGDGRLAPARTFMVGGIDLDVETRAGSVAVADVDGDGTLDLLAGTCFGEKCASSLFVLAGNGDGSFETATPYDAGGFGAGLVVTADVNGDAAPDAVVASCADWRCSSGSAAILLRDTASGTGARAQSDTSRDLRTLTSASAITTGTPGAAAYNLRVVSDASPDLTDLNSLIYSTTSRWPSNAEKVWALFRWSHILRRQTSPIVVHGFEITDPIRNFTDYGFTMCSTISGINQVLYEALGLRHEYWDICNHTVANVEFDGRFHMVDNSMSNLVTLDDGVTLASVVEAAADSARLVRLRSLYATSPNGFLTGSDTIRTLVDTTSPVDGSTTAGFSNAFCATGLKKRDYFYNWNAGHRYVLNLQQDESYTRYYRRLGTTTDYWIGSEDVSTPNPAATFQNDSTNRFGLHGNGAWSFTAPLTAETYERALYRATNIAAATGGGLQPSSTDLPGEAIYKVQAADVIASQKIQAQFSVTDAAATATIAISLNHGATWLPVGSVSGAVGSPVPLTVSLRNEVNGAYENLVRIQLTSPSGVPAAVTLTGLTIDTITHVNTKALPALNIGRNEIYVGAGDQSDTMVLWPDLRGTFWQKDVYSSQNIASQDVSVPREYTAVVYPSVLTSDAHLTYRFDAPTDVTRVTYGGRLYNYTAGSYIDFLHSFDGGATWIRSYRLSTVNAPYDVIHYETVAAPPGVRTVLFKYLIHNTSTTIARASGLYAARMEVNHRPAGGSSSPIDVTWSWKEMQANRTTVARTHTQRINAFPFKYVINVGGSDHPVLESVKVKVAGESTGSGYSDGVDAGGPKYVPQKRTEGTNFAQGKPYTFSPAPTVFQSSAGATNTTLLTDGVVGAPLTGSISYWWGQCWTTNQNVIIQVDLGQQQAIGAIRAHLFGYPGLDALKGQVQDRVELQTSTDGVTFTSQGLLPTALWKRDIPVNHMLLDDETATGWNFEQRLASPVSGRYVRYLVTPKRSYLCLSELQVFDRIDYTPFDLRLVLPSMPGDPPPNQPPTARIVSPAAATTFTTPATVQIAADAADSDGTVAHVDFLINGVPVSDDTAAPWGTTWNSTTPGTYTLMARAYDEAGNVGTSPPVSIIVQTPPTPGEDVVLWAAEAPVVPGWPVTAEAGAAGGARLQNQDLGVSKVAAALASPSQYFDLTFHAIQGRGYRLWIRGKAQGDAYVNDSAFVQFDHSVDQSGTAVYRIGSTDATVYSVEDCTACGLAGWGWSDNGYGMNGALIYFDSTGPQRVRVQVREDGLAIDQIVLSSKRWLTQAPGNTKNDTIVLAKTDSQQTTNQPPTVNVSSPAANATFTIGGSVTVNANAADTDGTVARVEFLVDGVVVANDTAAPWTTTWTAGPAGSYTLGARAYDDAAAATTSASVSITVTAPANQPPTVGVSSPAANATFTTGATVTINANAADADGTVARVEFLVNGAVIADDTAAPWTTTWTAGPAGSYTLGARAYDDAGAATTSAPVSITVTAPSNQPPTVSVSSPAANATFTTGATVTINANAADADGTVARVEFLVNGAVIANDTAAPWTTIWTAGAAGNYTLTARAYDNAGATTTSAPLAIGVTAAANQPPTIRITQPASGTTAGVPSTLTIVASVADPDGTVTRVEFLVNGTIVGNVTAAPWQTAHTISSPGTYTLTARAYDNAGAATTSASVIVKANRGGR